MKKVYLTISVLLLSIFLVPKIIKFLELTKIFSQFGQFLKKSGQLLNKSVNCLIEVYFLPQNLLS